MNSWYLTFRNNWSEALEEKNFLMRFTINAVVCTSLYMAMVHFLAWNRLTPGVILNDPIQKFFVPRDFSTIIFSITYSCAILFIIYIIARPRDFYYVARAFLVVFLLRGVFIVLIPLVPPTDTVPLHDPFLDFLVGENKDILNDLFYSGHMADLCIFFLCCRSVALKSFTFLSAIAVAIMLVWQHVHYTADVIGAPFFAYVCYALFVKGKWQE